MRAYSQSVPKLAYIIKKPPTAYWAFLNGREQGYSCEGHNDSREEKLKRSASEDAVYKWTRYTNLQELCTRGLCPLPADATSQLDVLGHDRHPLGMDCTQIGVLKEPHQVCLWCFLQRQNRRALEAQIGLEVLSDLPHQSLERKLADEKFRRLLVLTNFAKRNSPRPVSMRLLHTPCSRRRFPRGLGGQLLSWRLPSSRLPRRLLSTSHGREEKLQKENKDKLSNTQTPKHEGRRKKSTRRTKSQSSNYGKGFLKIHTTEDLDSQHKRYILSSSFEYDSDFPPLEHLHWCSVCGPALEMLDEMQQSYPGNTLLRPWKYTWLLPGLFRRSPGCV